ncbi:hypothetical protein SmJEL517_g05450 [Synchytrium microbalum]|uniref:Stress-activated map kinase-interacting protein 1 n=1 Tax=Synchytrium microbalum TaxID=1806994 RepID=A0A507BV30_9FUNG|nr:uncharacterized protein SmJEL517_g05450 [Synchytrium microbalum]TPX31118.1 hypothetical protein SmJEL517_g05450 [Synchytrium microbalum]
MSLITDAEYLIYRMRTTLLSVPDPLTERVITLPTESDNDYILAEQPNNNMEYRSKFIEENLLQQPATINAAAGPGRIRVRTGITRKSNSPRGLRQSGLNIKESTNDARKSVMSTTDTIAAKRASNITTRGIMSPQSAKGIKSPESAKTPDTNRPESAVGNSADPGPRNVEAALAQAEIRRQVQLQALKEQLAAEECKVEALTMEIAAAAPEVAPETETKENTIPLVTVDERRRRESESSSIAQQTSIQERQPGENGEPPLVVEEVEDDDDDDNEVFLKPPADAIDDKSDHSADVEDDKPSDSQQPTISATGASARQSIAASGPREMAYSISKDSDVSDEYLNDHDDVAPEVLNLSMRDLGGNETSSGLPEPESVIKVEGDSIESTPVPDTGGVTESTDTLTTQSVAQALNTVVPTAPVIQQQQSRRPSQQPLQQQQADAARASNVSRSSQQHPSPTVSRHPSKSSSQYSSASKLFQTNLFAKRELLTRSESRLAAENTAATTSSHPTLPRSESGKPASIVTSMRGSASQLLDSLRHLGTRPVSALTALINERANTNNPFADEYSCFSGKADPDSVRIKIYIPFREHHPRPLMIKVKRDATVEDVIGYILYEYINQSITPPLPEKGCDVIMWCLRIVEDDGSIDDDFPALERSRKIHKFAFDQFALCEASAEQVAAERTRRVAAIKSASISSTAQSTPTSATSASSASQILYIRVHLYSTIEVKQTTTLQLPGTTVLSEVFEQVCKKRKYEPKDYVLKMVDTKTDVPLDKTLTDLKTTEFCILKRDRGGAGDIFLRPPDEVNTGDNQPQFMISDEYTSMYKQYTVMHKHFMGRQERTLTIDGEYIHVLAPENRTLFESAKTNSHHISTVVSCKSKSNSANFKLLVQRVDRDYKSYDLEALSANEAYEICQRITWMSKMVKKDLGATVSTSSLNLAK